MLVSDKKRLRKRFLQVAVVSSSIYFCWVRNFSRFVGVDDTGFLFEINFPLLFIAIHTDARSRGKRLTFLTEISFRSLIDQLGLLDHLYHGIFREEVEE